MSQIDSVSLEENTEGNTVKKTTRTRRKTTEFKTEGGRRRTKKNADFKESPQEDRSLSPESAEISLGEENSLAYALSGEEIETPKASVRRTRRGPRKMDSPDAVTPVRRPKKKPLPTEEKSVDTLHVPSPSSFDEIPVSERHVQAKERISGHFEDISETEKKIASRTNTASMEKSSRRGGRPRKNIASDALSLFSPALETLDDNSLLTSSVTDKDNAENMFRKDSTETDKKPVAQNTSDLLNIASEFDTATNQSGTDFFATDLEKETGYDAPSSFTADEYAKRDKNPMDPASSSTVADNNDEFNKISGPNGVETTDRHEISFGISSSPEERNFNISPNEREDVDSFRFFNGYAPDGNADFSAYDGGHTDEQLPFSNGNEYSAYESEDRTNSSRGNTSLPPTTTDNKNLNTAASKNEKDVSASDVPDETPLPFWEDDGIVRNILPYAGDFPDDLKSHRRINPRVRRKRDKDAQAFGNASPFTAERKNAFDKDASWRKQRGKKIRPKNALEKQEFSPAAISDSVLGSTFHPSLPSEEDGPQPFLPDQPSILSSFGSAEEDFEALDAAVNGNRITPSFREHYTGFPERNLKRNAKANKSYEERQTEKVEKDEKPTEQHIRRVLYVSSTPDEQVEVAITENGLLAEYFVEMAHQVKIRGNIYKGVVCNIDTNLQAAFVDYGNDKNGFLQIDEVHPEYYNCPHEPSSGQRFPLIQKALKVGQELLVQVVKEPAGSKGAFLTTWLSIAGRFLVLTPGQEQIGVSRKVEDQAERARLKELLNGIQPGENMGVIIRTASEGACKSSIQQDIQYLKKLWEDIRSRAPEAPCPSLLYQEADLVTRSVRDYLSEDIVEIWVDTEEMKKRVEAVTARIFPDKAKDLIRFHRNPRQSLWERFGLLRQLESVTSREVFLPSGGRLVFDQTEALMAIDINSGKTQGKNSFESMVFKTNMEAVDAIARHLRLRDIGGQVVIDFIEMRDKNHCREIERAMRAAMHRDRARHDIGHLSPFSLMELVRQRTGTSAISISCEPCPHCHGTGLRRNMEWQALQSLRELKGRLSKSMDGRRKRQEKDGKIPVFSFECGQELALYFLNSKRDRLTDLEEKYGVQIEIKIR